MCVEIVRPINATSPKSRTVPTVSGQGLVYMRSWSGAGLLAVYALSTSHHMLSRHPCTALKTRSPTPVCLHRVLIAAAGAASPREVVLVVWGRVRVIVEGAPRQGRSSSTVAHLTSDGRP